jgi:hypothetical protein
MTIPKALPPGVNHHAATRAAAAQVQGMADAAIQQATAPRPDSPKRVMKAEIISKTIRHIRAK